MRLSYISLVMLIIFLQLLGSVNYPSMSRLSFDNRYGVSVIRTLFTYGGKEGLYELAVLDEHGNLTYDTSITNDVIGYLSEDEVSDIMSKY